MRAARVHRHGDPPVVDDVAEPRPEGDRVVVEVVAAAVNPIDLSIASGRFYAGAPPLPHAPGREAVGRVAGTAELVYVERPAEGWGTFAERTLADRDALAPLPGGTDPVLAVCLGIAGLAGWLPVAERARVREGERVLVLGASGAVGQVAVQAARLHGAGRVVAAARSEDGLRRAERLGADATVRLDDDTAPSDLADRLTEAAAGPLDVVIDPLWGDPARAAVEAMGPGGRLVQIGQSAGAEATLPSAAVRGRQLEILGHTNFAARRDVRRAAHRRMLEHAGRGELHIDRETLPLDAIADAWERQERSPHVKLVLVP